jgi:hypothetical protein
MGPTLDHKDRVPNGLMHCHDTLGVMTHATRGEARATEAKDQSLLAAI